MDEFIRSIPLPAWLMTPAGLCVYQNDMCAQLPVAMCCQALGARAGVTALDEKLDLGDQGVWRVVLFPVMSGQVSLIGGMAFRLTMVEAARKQAQIYRDRLETLASNVQTIRADERAEISRDIHDQLGQEITVLRLALGRLQRDLAGSGKNSRKLESQVADLAQQTATIMQSAHRIAASLRPEVLLSRGLALAAGDLVRDIRQRIGIRGHLEISSQWKEPDADLALHLYRSLQELLTNMIKHAKASRFFVRLILAENSVYWLEVIDNGIGLPQSVIRSQCRIGCMGLSGLHERAAIYGGNVVMQARPQIEGSAITLTLPQYRGAHNA